MNLSEAPERTRQTTPLFDWDTVINKGLSAEELKELSWDTNRLRYVPMLSYKIYEKVSHEAQGLLRKFTGKVDESTQDELYGYSSIIRAHDEYHYSYSGAPLSRIDPSEVIKYKSYLIRNAEFSNLHYYIGLTRAIEKYESLYQLAVSYGAWPDHYNGKMKKTKLGRMLVENRDAREKAQLDEAYIQIKMKLQDELERQQKEADERKKYEALPMIEYPSP